MRLRGVPFLPSVSYRVENALSGPKIPHYPRHLGLLGLVLESQLQATAEGKSSWSKGSLGGTRREPAGSAPVSTSQFSW